MAVTTKQSKRTLKIVQQTTNAAGDTVSRTKTLGEINPAATDQEIYDSGRAVGTLFSETTQGVFKDELTEIVSA